MQTQDIEGQIGPRGATRVSDANAPLVRQWLATQGIPAQRAARMRPATLYKAYNFPRYLAAIQAKTDGGDDNDTGTAQQAPETNSGIEALKAALAETLETIAGMDIPTRGDVATLASEAALSVLSDETIMHAIVAKYATRSIKVETARGKTVDVGAQHRTFETLLQACAARTADGHRLNVWLAGPAGSGKTTAAKMVAKALGLPFFFNGAIDNEYKLLGFTDAQGRIVSRPFREAYINGGVYLFDEVDASLPGALLAFNAATANGSCDFPDGIKQRHDNCIIIAAGNTHGHGATSEYVGRMKLDAAFLDRFVAINWDIDEALELALCPDTEWCRFVQSTRAKAKAQGLKVIVSPRASIYGAALLAQGLDRPTVIAMTLRKGMSEDQAKSLNIAT